MLILCFHPQYINIIKKVLSLKNTVSSQKYPITLIFKTVILKEYFYNMDISKTLNELQYWHTFNVLMAVNYYSF